VRRLKARARGAWHVSAGIINRIGGARTVYRLGLRSPAQNEYKLSNPNFEVYILDGLIARFYNSVRSRYYAVQSIAHSRLLAVSQEA
jgi:hypothetical protein